MGETTTDEKTEAVKEVEKKIKSKKENEEEKKPKESKPLNEADAPSYFKILCVRTGNRYKKEYVDKLYNMVKRNIKIPFKFICYTDDQADLNVNDDSLIQYKATEKSGWWGKIDLFQETGPCLFFDLDTIIVNDITKFAKQVSLLKEQTICMIKPWQKKGWASGVMAWNDSLNFLTKDFISNDVNTFKWDQKYITYKLKEYEVNILPMQDFIYLYSYKHHCRMNTTFPKGAEVICFHGRPNPHEVKDRWVKEYWR